jgi:3-hydroxybutyryl-CoA dehydrogenase
VIGTNTSAIPIGELAKSVDGPERFMGVHWMNPAPFVPAIELIPTPHTTEDAAREVPQ